MSLKALSISKELNQPNHNPCTNHFPSKRIVSKYQNSPITQKYSKAMLKKLYLWKSINKLDK